VKKTMGAILATLIVLAPAAFWPSTRGGKAADVRTEAFVSINEGVSAYKRGDYVLAVQKLQRAASLALNSFRAHFYLGLALIGDRRYADALNALEIALDLEPTHLQSLVASGDAYLKMGDLAEAQAAYFRAIKLRPEYAPSLDGLARIYEARGDDEQAVVYFQRAISSDSGFAPAFTHLGDLYLRRRQYDEAVRLLEEAVSVRPDFAPGLNRLARAYGRLGLNNLAVATIQRAMELQPKDPLHPATLGWLQLQEGLVDTAEEWFNTALALDASLPMARTGLAEVDRRRGHYDDALEELDTALADDRVDATWTRRLQKFRDEIVEEQAHVAALEQKVETAEALPGDFAELAEVYARRGLWNEAVELQRLAGEEPVTRELLAYMLFQAERFREAHEIYTELADALQSVQLEVNEGISVARLGNDRAAVAAFNRALALDPEQAEARLYLGNALLRLGEREEAAQAYRAFLSRVSTGESAERVRRILEQIAPDETPAEPSGDAEPATAEPAYGNRDSEGGTPS
jgi:tetratricopeptide (TPR) repeat protein